jgi:DNA (cytosine-5)-methyltransferase 1
MLRVGTDCSGIEAPIEALRQLNIPYEHVFSSEIDKYCIKSIKANYSPKIIFGDPDGPFKNGDIRERNIKDIPDIDLYVCGFPCQPFSSAGERKGINDKRGNVFFSCLEVIKFKQPKYFILENVKGLKTHDKGKTWSRIWNELLKLKEYGYNIDWRILNTRDYGIPQNRERIFIIGNKEKEIIWPKKKEMDKLENYIDYNDNTIYISKTVQKYNNCINKNAIFINTDFLKYTNFPDSNIYSPCIGAQTTLYNMLLKRYANVKEFLLLQGFDINFKNCISSSKLKKQIGNSISVNVLKVLLKCLILNF